MTPKRSLVNLCMLNFLEYLSLYDKFLVCMIIHCLSSLISFLRTQCFSVEFIALSAAPRRVHRTDTRCLKNIFLDEWMNCPGKWPFPEIRMLIFNQIWPRKPNAMSQNLIDLCLMPIVYQSIFFFTHYLLTLSAVLSGRCYYFFFTDEETEVQRRWVTYSRLHS